MALLSVTDGRLILGGKELFSGLECHIAPGERIGLVGPNGSGKSSLLRILAGKLALDQGTVHSRRGLRVGYLPQHMDLPAGQPLLQFVRAQAPERSALEAEQRELQRAMHQLDDAAAAPAAEQDLLALSEKLADVQSRLDQLELTYAEHIAARILSGLGFSAADFQRDLAELSGGWRMRAVLAGLLFSQPDVLLLDEPTNHLDMPTVAWLSSHLRRYEQAFVLVSHDQEFLDEQIERVLSFEPEGVRSYSGNFSAYVAQREQEREILANRAKNLQRQREEAEAFIARFRAKATKAKAVQSRIKALERMEDVTPLAEHQHAEFHFPATRRTSREMLRADGLRKAFGGHVVFENVNLRVNRGERIAVIGINGAGKTTLLRLLAGVLPADSGSVRLGHHVERGYYAQEHAETLGGLAKSQRSDALADATSPPPATPTGSTPGQGEATTVLQEVSRAAPRTDATTLRGILGALMFRGDDVDKPLHVLSGGERARVALAKILAVPSNLLLMDEPTNHLDLQSSQRLAEALESFAGALVFVSHNRHFIRSLATQIWNVQSGEVEIYPGTLDEYMDSAVRRLEVAIEASDAVPSRSPDAPGAKGPPQGRAADKARKRREAQQRAARRRELAPLEARVDELEASIEALEARQAERNAQLANPDVYNGTADTAALLRAYHADAAELERLTAEWETAYAALQDATAQYE